MDHLKPSERSRNMAAIKGRNTSPELAVRKLVHSLGYRFRLHDPRLPGKPDLVLRRHRAVIFVHGCFWHQHGAAHCKARLPKSNLQYWMPKLERNVARFTRQRAQLRAAGWRVLTVWECQVRDLPKLKAQIARFLAPQ
jgi:DNA mismatch endonuclease (patch repair protein)